MANENGKRDLIDAAANPESKPVRTLTSLLDLPNKDVPVRIEMDSETLVIPCRAMTYKRFREIGRLVPDPSPPVMAGRNGKMYDYQDPEYNRQRADADEQRLYLRIAEFVQLDIPNTSKGDLKARAAWIAENMEMGIVKALSNAIDQTIVGGEAHVEARAASFQPV